jgi:hypothetical protein
MSFLGKKAGDFDENGRCYGTFFWRFFSKNAWKPPIFLQKKGILENFFLFL